MPAQQPPSAPADDTPPEDAVPAAPEDAVPAPPEAGEADTGAPEAGEAGTAAPETADEPVGPTRRERRAARGGEAAKVAGPAVGRRPNVPAKHRDYASRRRG